MKTEIAASSDGGKTWAPPVEVTDSRGGDFPWLTAADHGRSVPGWLLVATGIALGAGLTAFAAVVVGRRPTRGGTAPGAVPA